MFQKISIPLTEGTFVLDPQPGDACHIPLPTGISVIFQLGLVPCGNNTFVKNAVALYFYAKDNLRQREKKIVFYVNKVPNNLNFAL